MFSTGDATIGQVTPQPWRRSSTCASETCVEVHFSEDLVRVRDSKKSYGEVLSFSTDEWRSFVAGVKNSEFDA